MNTGHIPVLLDIVERGSNAPDENQVQSQSVSPGVQHEVGNEDPTIPRAVQNSSAQQPDLETTDKRPVIPEHMIEQMLDEPADRKEMIDRAMAILMPRLEAMARKTIEQLLEKNSRTGKS